MAESCFFPRLSQATVQAYVTKLSRPFGKLAHKGCTLVAHIQLSLGHSSMQTTELNLGVEQNLTTAPCDLRGLA